MEETQLQPAEAVPETGKAVTKFGAEHGREVGLPSPQAINFMVSTANLVLNSSLVTADMGTTVEQIKANAIAKMLVGHELGIGAIQSLRDVDIVKGRIFVRYPQLIAQMLKLKFKLKWVERTHTRAALLVTPPEDYPMMEELFEFTIEDAKMAKLTEPTRNGEPSQYTKRPRVMLASRVVSEAYRMMGGGANIYTTEERQEIVESLRHQEEPPADPEVRRAQRAEVVKEKLEDLRGATSVVDVEVVPEEPEVDDTPEEYGDEPENSPEPPEYELELARVVDKLTNAKRADVVGQVLEKHGIVMGEEFSEPQATAALADFEDYLRDHPLKKNGAKQRGFSLS